MSEKKIASTIPATPGLIDICGEEAMQAIYAGMTESLKTLTITEESFKLLLQGEFIPDDQFANMEEMLYKLEIVKECVVVARPHDGEDDVITALIHPDFDKLQGKTDKEVITEVKAQVAVLNKTLPTFKQIRNIELRKTEFEKTTTRKIMRHKV